MKIAIIAPTKFLSAFCTTDCQLCYAHLVLEDEVYRGFYLERSRLGDVVILDSSFQIPRRALDFSALMQAINLVKPTYVVLPDVDFSCEKTVEKSLSIVGSIPTKTIGNLQGVVLDDLRRCYKNLKGSCSMIGLPLSNEKVLKREWIIKRLRISQDCFYLGTYRDPIEELPIDSNVLGISTDFPFRLGYDLRKLSEYYPEPPQIDFNANDIPIPELVEGNIEHFLELCKEATEDAWL